MKKGTTLVELVAVIAVLTVLIAVIIPNLNIVENQNKARDTKRLSDLNLIDQAINAYRIDAAYYPGSPGTLMKSTLLPSGGTQLENSTTGWIDSDLSKYLSKMPVDPINDSTYFYSYYHDNSGYEINVVLEFMMEKMSNDGGDDINVYEMGNNLLLISP